MGKASYLLENQLRNIKLDGEKPAFKHFFEKITMQLWSHMLTEGAL